MARKFRESEKTVFRKYEVFIENLYNKSRFYRELVYFSRFVKMITYIVLGASIIAVTIFGTSMTSFEAGILWMTRSLPGKVIAILVAISLIIYGIEKPR